MSLAQTQIATANASKYLEQLCKHWAHKMAVEFNTEDGLVPFSAEARCRLHADATALHVSIEAPDDQASARLGDVVVDHLRRFAHREPFANPVWTIS